MPIKTLGPRVIIAGTASGVGKTTVATTIMAALSSMGYHVAPAKVGPDFIDPSYHELACGLRSKTLDSFLLGQNAIRESLAIFSQHKDISIIEGVMGLYDGTLMSRFQPENINFELDPKITIGSTAEIAAITQTPVILVVDATATSSSLGAIVEGFINYSTQVNIQGIIINNFGSQSHLELIKKSLLQTNIEIVGTIRRGSVPTWRSRHLGLIPVIENKPELQQSIATLCSNIAPSIDLMKIVEIASSAPRIKVQVSNPIKKPQTTTIAVASGKSFSFTYPENIEALINAGANVKFFDPLLDPTLPSGTSGLYLGGGFPEIYAKELSMNKYLNMDIHNAVVDGMPTWAECGGMMWLSQEVDGNKMVGALTNTVQMTNKLTLGYAVAKSISDNCLSERDTQIVGHEFHYSNSNPPGTSLHLSTRNGTKLEGFTTKSLFASYLHINLGSQQHLADRFIDHCQ